MAAYKLVGYEGFEPSETSRIQTERSDQTELIPEIKMADAEGIEPSPDWLPMAKLSRLICLR